MGSNVAWTHEEYEDKLLKAELDVYPVEVYQTAKTLITHECLKGHQWLVRPYDVLRGRGCPICNKSGIKYNQPTMLYFLSFHYKNELYYKLGITNKTLKERFGPEWTELKFKVIWLLDFNTGHEAFDLEQKLKQKYSDNLVNTGALRKGNTETFNQPIPKPPTR